MIPARPRKPKDKAKVEVAVQVVERWILARLRKQTFFSLAELNRAVAALVGGLSAERYVYAEWKKVRVNRDTAVVWDC